ncbi:class I SAM-dependent methyltransferase [Pseudomonas sp. LS44]|uniref:class I SAM-dependent methyltransferase n=1 Tax=Pseudomonas sp. LS44 TaxID=1357074 RepID=UPI00215A232E|nr:class I SAM-dependent methyltransferase [Pseudomonas sp. LS44]UVE17945.1 class I SAM-dependent methyltransferase [Pseudomonas sp. LS44]
MKWLKKYFGSSAPADNSPVHSAATQNCGLVDAVRGGWFQNDSDELYRGFPISADDIVLDVGCGGGGASQFCARRGAHLIFTDSDAAKVEALRIALQHSAARQIEGIVSDSLPLPLADAHASRIIALEMLEHVERPADVLNELYRVGRPGALYFLSVPARESELLQQTVAPASHFQAPNHINVFSAEQFAELVSGAGLEIIERHSYGFFWALWMMFYWTAANAEGRDFTGATHNQLTAPYPSLVNDWSALWHAAIELPGGPALAATMDKTLPKTQIIIARKPI